MEDVNKEIMSADDKYNTWLKKYHTVEICDIKKFINWYDCITLKKLGIEIKNKKYTGYELECLQLEIARYDYEPSEELDIEEREFLKDLDETDISKKRYNKLLKKIDNMVEQCNWKVNYK